MNENEAILEVVQPTRRRRHSKEFKEKVIRAAMQPNVSIAAVALHYQLNANLLRRWVAAQEEQDATREARQARLLAVRDLLGREEREEIPIRPGFPLGAVDELPPDAARIREVQAFEEGVQVGVGGDHDRPPTRRGDAAVLGRVQALRCAPALRAPAAAWTQPPRGSEAAAIVGGRSSSKGNDGIGAPR